MSKGSYSDELSELVERVKNMTSEQADTLGTTWTSQEAVSYLPESAVDELDRTQLREEIPLLQNIALQNAWQRASSVASAEGRADELAAAIAAEKAAEHAVRHFTITPLAKAGAVEAARAAVLAVGVRDIIDDDQYQLLVAPWQEVFGAL